MIPHGLLEDLDTWESQGDRSVKIEKSRGIVRIWVYDYEIMEGCFVERSEDIPTSKNLNAMKIKAARATLAELEGA